VDERARRGPRGRLTCACAWNIKAPRNLAEISVSRKERCRMLPRSLNGCLLVVRKLMIQVALASD
jgi:hypothetical protein